MQLDALFLFFAGVLILFLLGMLNPGISDRILSGDPVQDVQDHRR